MPNRFAKPASAKYWASKKTVDGHRGQIREKLGIGSVAELVRLVLNNPHGDAR